MYLLYWLFPSNMYRVVYSIFQVTCPTVLINVKPLPETTHIYTVLWLKNWMLHPLVCPEWVLSLQHQSGNYSTRVYRTKKETQAERIRLTITSIPSNFSFIDIIWVEQELQREAGSNRWCRFQGIMLTLATGINNLKEERNDPFFSAGRLIPHLVL